jgi:hypothetical protein
MCVDAECGDTTPGGHVMLGASNGLAFAFLVVTVLLSPILYDLATR